jgi:hypothetical protein
MKVEDNRESGHELPTMSSLPWPVGSMLDWPIRTLAGALKSMSSVNRDTLLLWAWADPDLRTNRAHDRRSIGTVRSRSIERSVLRHASNQSLNVNRRKNMDELTLLRHLHASAKSLTARVCRTASPSHPTGDVRPPVRSNVTSISSANSFRRPILVRMSVAAAFAIVAGTIAFGIGPTGVHLLKQRSC